MESMEWERWIWNLHGERVSWDREVVWVWAVEGDWFWEERMFHHFNTSLWTDMRLWSRMSNFS
jgi:hypothetical protein